MKVIKKYNYLIGTLKFIMEIGRLYIETTVMTMYKFRTSPKQGHLDRVKRIFGCLYCMKHVDIRFRFEIPYYSSIENPTYNWENRFMVKLKNILPMIDLNLCGNQ